MAQDINFYALMKRKSRWSALLEPLRLVLVFFVFFVVLVLVSLNDVRRARTAAAAFSVVQSRHMVAENRLKTFVGDSYEEGVGTLGLQHAMGDAEMAAYIPQVLTALSEAVTKGLWLTTISVSSTTDNKLTLEGVTRSPSTVQFFLQKMSQQPAFKGMAFQLDGLRENPPAENDTASSLSFRVVGTG